MVVSIQNQASESKVVIVSKKKIADEIGVSDSYVCACFKGRRQLNRRQAKRIEKRFGIPITFWPRIAA